MEKRQVILSRANIRVGLKVICLANPEWGTWIIRKDREGWSTKGESGEPLLSPDEFHFYGICQNI